MSEMNLPEAAIPINQRSLTTLERAIRLSLGQFSLILTRCNYTSLRDEMIHQLQGMASVPIQLFTLPGSTKTLYSSLHQYWLTGATCTTSLPQALMVLGLEMIQDLDATLISTNQVREEFRKHCSFPLVLWVNDRVLQKLALLAPDFKAWAATTIRFEMPIPALISSLHSHADRLFASILELGDERFMPNAMLFLAPNSLRRDELEFALSDIRASGQTLATDLQASLDFLLGRDAHAEGQLETARDYYERSLDFWLEASDQSIPVPPAADAFQPVPHIERAACVLFHLGLLWRTHGVLQRATYESSLRQAQIYFERSLELFTQENRQDLVSKFIIPLAEVLQKLGQWNNLAVLASNALVLHKLYHDPVRQARDYGFLAEVALARGDWSAAKQQVEQAQQILARAETEVSSIEHPDPHLEESLGLAHRYHQGWYSYLLAQAEVQLGQPEAAIAHLETALKESFPQNDPLLYIQMLSTLRDLYFAQGRYLDAFHTKQTQRSLEQQYGFRAFVGALRLEPQRHLLNPALEQIQIDSQALLAQEIAASGREEDVRALLDRIGRNDIKLTVLHGPSGVGKSSILTAGLIPWLKKYPINGRVPLPLLCDRYTDWQISLIHQLTERLKQTQETEAGSQAAEEPLPEPWLAVASSRPNEPEQRTNDLSRSQNFEAPVAALVEQDLAQTLMDLLQRAIGANYLPVLIFDQFEEFFFAHETLPQRRSFYEVLRNSLYTEYVKVILSLREDYLHYLLEFQRFDSLAAALSNLPVLDNISDILGKTVRYPLRDLAPERARQVIMQLTSQAQFDLEDALIDELVKDLAGDLGEVRPIELQVVGAELQAEAIDTLAEYIEKGPKRRLVEKSLAAIVRDCGPENEAAARLVLFLLTNDNGTRPLKTRTDLEADLLALDLEEEVPRLELVLKVLVGSGLVFQIPESPEDSYQLVHDYLVPFIREQQGSEISRLQTELEKERALRQLTQEELRQTVVRLQTALENEELLTDSLSAEALLSSHLELEALLQAIATGKRLLSSTQVDSPSRLRAIAAIRQVVYGVHEVNRLQGHSVWVSSISFSPNGQWLASASGDHSLKLWNLAGQELQTFTGHSDRVNGVSFSPDGLHLASASSDGTVKLWNLEGQELKTLTGHSGSISGVSFSPDGQILATASADRTVKLWSLQGQELQNLIGHEGRVYTVNFSPDGSLLASASADGTVKLWTATGTRLRSLEGHDRAVRSACFSPDGQFIASASADGTVKLWTRAGEVLQTFKAHKDWVRSVCFSPNGQLLASASADSTVRLWSIDGRELQIFRGHRWRVNGVAFSVDGHLLASASDDSTVKLWSIPGQPLTVLQEHSDTVTAVQFAPISNSQPTASPVLATASEDGTVRCWHLTNRQPFLTNVADGGKITSIGFSPDGQTLAAGNIDSTIALWSMQGEMLHHLRGHGGRINQVCFSPDGTRLASASADSTIKLWDQEGDLVQTLKGHTDWVKSISFSPMGDQLASASIDGTIRLWEKDGNLLRMIQTQSGRLSYVCFSPTGDLIASASDDYTVKLWSLTGQLLQILRGHSGWVSSLSFSADGQILASASGDGTVKLWSINGRELQTLRGHTSGVMSVSFSPDNQTLASGGADRTVILWNLDLKNLLHNGCHWLHNYLTYNSVLEKSDRCLCLGLE